MNNPLNGLTPEALHQESQRTADSLALHSGRGIAIKVGDQAFTAAGHGENRELPAINIALDQSWLNSVRKQEQALKIWRGLAARELARALSPASEQYGQAVGPGALQVFHVLNDEHCMRQAIAAMPELGPDFQALNAFLFPTKGAQSAALSTGTVNGGIDPAGGRRGGVTGTVRFGVRFNQFAYRFRRQLPLTPMAEHVDEALSHIGHNVKDLSKGQLLNLATDIGVILASGIDEKEEQAHVDAEPAPTVKPVKNDAAPGAPAPLPPPNHQDPDRKPTWTLKRILTNPLTLVGFGAFVAFWSYILLQAGVQFWVVATGASVAAVGMLGMVVAYHRAAAGSLLRGFWDAIGGGLKIALMAALCAVCVALVVVLVVTVPWQVLALGISALGVLITGMCAWRNSSEEDEQSFFSNQRVIGLSLAGFGSALGGSIYFTMLKEDLPHSMALFYGLSVGITLVVTALPMIWQPSGEAKAGGFIDSLRSIITGPGRLVTFVLALIGAFFAWMFSGVAAGWRRFKLGFKRFCSRVGGLVVAGCRGLREVFWQAEPTMIRLWGNPLSRIAILSLPFAVVTVMLLSVLFAAGEVSIVLLVILGVVMLAMLLTAFVFRDKLRGFVVEELYEPVPDMAGSSDDVPLDMETEEFSVITDVEQVQANWPEFRDLASEVNTLAAIIRPAIVDMGLKVIDKGDQEDGDLGDEAELIQAGDLAIHDDDHQVPATSLHLEIGVDCSQSEGKATGHLPAGAKFRNAIVMALALEEALNDLEGVSARLWGYDDHVIYDCGVIGERRLSGLTLTGGNNDAAMLRHMRESAAGSGKQIQILGLFSDGQPSDSSWRALRNEVLAAGQDNAIVWQFATDRIKTHAIDRVVTDLFGQTLDEAAASVAETFRSIAQEAV